MLYLLERVSLWYRNDGAKEGGKQKEKADMKGMEDGYNPHLRNVSRLTPKSWRIVSQASVSRCWVKTMILPTAVEADLNNQWKKMQCKTTKEAAAKIAKLFESLSVSEKQIALESNDMTTDLSVEKATAWLDIERDEQVQSALGDEIVAADGESRATGSRFQTDREPDKDENSPTDPVCAPILPARPLSAMFSDHEELAFNASLFEVGMLLRRTKGAFKDARKSRKNDTPR